MTPKGPEELHLSKMDMAGIGKAMLEKMMEDTEEVMGFKQEEFIPEFKIINVTDYLKNALSSDIQLFV